MKKIIITIVAFFIVAAPASAYYHPGTPSGFVNDYANIIDDEVQAQIESKLSVFKQETSNEVTVVTIESLAGDDVENFAVKLFADWGIGNADNDNGVLVLVAVADRKMRIEVGYGLEGALTDAQSFWIIENIMKPAFREENYGGGLSEATDAIIAATKGEFSIEDQQSSGGLDYEFIFWIIIFAFLWLGSILGRSKSWWAGGVIGGLAGLIVALVKGFVWFGLGAIIILVPFGLLFDFIVSKNYHSAKASGRRPPWWIGGGGFGGGMSGGFGGGGFGGGMSGGGGSSGGW